MEVKLKMPQAEIISDRLTKFIYLKMIDDKVLTQNDPKEAGINTKKIIKEAVETKLNLGIVSIASVKYGVIGTRESDELIKSYLLGFITMEELSSMLGKDDPSYMILVYRDRYKIKSINKFKEKYREPIFIKTFTGEITREQAANEVHLSIGSFNYAYYTYLKRHPDLVEFKKNDRLNTENTYFMMYYRNEIDLDTLASALNISKSYACNRFKKFMEDNNLPRKELRKLNHKFVKKAPYNDPAYEYLFRGYFSGKYSITYISKVTKYARGTVYTYLSDFRKKHPEYKNIRMNTRPPKYDKIFKDYINHKISIEEAMKQIEGCATKKIFYNKLCYYKRQNGIGIGKHTIRFPNFKKIEFEIVQSKVGSQKWLEQYNKWKIVKEDNLWNSERQSEGIIGLDFTSIPQFNEEVKGSVFERWSKMHIFGSKQINDNNIAIKVLSNIK